MIRRACLLLASLMVLAAGLTIATADAATALRAYTARLGASHGTAVLTIYTSGSGQIVLSGKGLARGSWTESVYQGTCVRRTLTIATFASLRVGSPGTATRTSSLTKSQVARLMGHGALIRLVHGSVVICGTFSSLIASPPTPTITIGRQDAETTVAVPRGANVLVKLGTDLNWTVSVGDPAILVRVPGVTLVRGAQGLYLAQRAGRTTITAVGDPACRSYQPPCMAPSLKWSLTVVVG